MVGKERWRIGKMRGLWRREDGREDQGRWGGKRRAIMLGD